MEIVQKNTEIMIKELEDIRQAKLLPDDTIRQIVVARRHLESKINNISKNIDDYRSYISHENLILNKIRKSRDRKKISEKKSSVDFSIIRRIRRLYKTALQRFPSEYSLHEGYYKFCKEHNFTPSASQAVDNMIKMFSYKPEAWKLASGWYCHLNDTNKALQVLHKGLTINPDSTILFSTAIELEIKEVSKSDCTPEEKLFKENKCGEKMKTYIKMFLKTIKNIDYIISILSLLEGHNYTNPAQQLILEYLFQNHSKEDIFWHMLAKREKKGMHFVTDPNESPRSDGFACIMYCIDKYEQGLLLVSEENKKKLWSNYLETLKHLLISENDKMRVIFEDGVRQPAEISNVLLPKYIEWIAFHDGIDAARARYRTLAIERPYCKELHLLMSKLEFSQFNK